VTAVADALAGLGARVGVSVALEPVAGTGRDAERQAGARAAVAALVAADCDHAAPPEHADDGRPLWPQGFTGSIGHTHDLAVAAATSTMTALGVGIDVEQSNGLDPDDAALVLDENERALVAANARPTWLATVIWSAKEAAFKAWNTHTNGSLVRVDPVDIHVDVDEAAGALSVIARGALRDVVSVAACGAYTEAEGVVLTLVALGDRVAG
jgi:4'-phosphopantetheinyl transferase EntD